MPVKSFFKAILSVFLLLSVPLGIVLVSQKTNFLQRAFGENANIVINANELTGLPDGAWKNLAQGGEEKGRPLAPVIEQVKKLSPQYIRIDHVFDFYNLADGDFSEFDNYLNDIRATGAIPFISLSYMPSRFTKNGDVTDTPNNWSDWENLVQKTVEHVSGKKGLNISNVYYEVWNEPDLFGKFKSGGNKSYIDLYIHTVNGVTRASNVNNYKVGGPVTTNLYKNWMDNMFKIKEQGVRVDFLSWHKYSKNLDDFEKDIKDITNYSEIEFLITETGINSENDPSYDNNLSAIHTIASNVIYEGAVSKVFNFEVKDGPNSDKKNWGRWGILTHEKFGTPEIKPRYKALQFLNLMTGKGVKVSGNGSWVKAFAKMDGDRYKILVVNYDPYGKHSEAVPITINNLPYDSFDVKRTNFLGGSVNMPILDKNKSWSVLLEFPPNTASIFEIIPK